MRYVSEVGLAKESVDVWQQWREVGAPNAEQACEAVLY
jgi:hypothetical protein